MRAAETYRQMHPGGPKSDPDNRIDAVDRAVMAGIDDIGIGALYVAVCGHYQHLLVVGHEIFNIYDAGSAFIDYTPIPALVNQGITP